MGGNFFLSFFFRCKKCICIGFALFCIAALLHFGRFCVCNCRNISTFGAVALAFFCIGFCIAVCIGFCICICIAVCICICIVLHRLGVLHRPAGVSGCSPFVAYLAAAGCLLLPPRSESPSRPPSASVHTPHSPDYVPHVHPTPRPVKPLTPTPTHTLPTPAPTPTTSIKTAQRPSLVRKGRCAAVT